MLGWLVYAVMSNIVRGDLWFAYRWFHDNPYLQEFIRIVRVKGAFQDWFSQYGVLTIMLIVVVTMLLFIIHRFAWRFLFKDYIRFTEGVETYEGRTFWTEGAGFWFNAWDSYYGRHVEKQAIKDHVARCIARAKTSGSSWIERRAVKEKAIEDALESLEKHPIYEPGKRPVTVYLKARRWPPIPNPVNPGRALWKNKLTAGSDEKLEKRGPYELVVHEGKYRRIIGVRVFATHNEPYASSEIPTSQAGRILKSRIKDLIKDTNELSKANVKVRLDKLRSGTVLIDPEIKEMALKEREKKEAQRVGETKAGA